MSNQKRHPEGTPVGGQFAAGTRPSADVTLVTHEDFAPGITEEDVDDFTHSGKCVALANALHERTGWPMVVVADTEARLGWFHAGVRTPEGTVIDIAGEHDKGDWLDQYAPIADEYGYDLAAEDSDYEYDGDIVQVCDPEDYGWAAENFAESPSPETAERAGQLADRLVEAYESGDLPRSSYLLSAS